MQQRAEQAHLTLWCAQVLNTFKVAAELGPESLSAYVISMATRPSDVLAVELLKREASLAVSSSTPSLRCSKIFCSLPSDCHCQMAVR